MSNPCPPLPNYEYVAYIDEAGDPGLKRVKGIDHNGASEWLVLGAVLMRRVHEKDAHGWVQNITKDFQGHQRFGIHFTNLNPAKKLLACQGVAKLPLRCFAVASNKKNMKGYRNTSAEMIPSESWFYCWLSRLLLERISHFVYRHSLANFGEPRLLKVVYSERGGISYAQMDAYYTWLKMRSSAGQLVLPQGDIAWPVMSRDLLEVHAANERAGLHFADVVASAFFKACDVYDTRACDPQFAKALRNRMARFPDNRNGRVAGYGLKMMPNFKKANLLKEQEAIFKYYGYPNEWWALDPSNS